LGDSKKLGYKLLLVQHYTYVGREGPFVMKSLSLSLSLSLSGVQHRSVSIPPSGAHHGVRRRFVAGVHGLRPSGAARRRRHRAALRPPCLVNKQETKRRNSDEQHGRSAAPCRLARAASPRRDGGVHLRCLLSAPRVLRREAQPPVSLICSLPITMIFTRHEY
jgi:hypothetical protein